MPKLPLRRTQQFTSGSRERATQAITNRNIGTVQDNTGSALAQLGNSISTTGSKLANQERQFAEAEEQLRLRQKALIKKKEDSEAKTRAALVASDFKLSTHHIFEEAKINAPQGATDFTKQAMDQFDTVADSLIAEEKNSSGKTALKLEINKQRLQLFDKSIAFESKSSIAAQQAQLEKTVDNYSKMNYLDISGYAENKEAFKNLIEGKELPQGVKTKILKDGNNKMSYQTGLSYAENSPQTFLSSIEKSRKPAFYKDLTPEQVNSLVSKATAIVKQRNSKLELDVVNAVKNASAQFLQTGMAINVPSDTQIDSIIANKSKAYKLKEDLKFSKKVGSAMVLMKPMSINEVRNNVEKVKPKIGDTNFARKQKEYEALKRAEASRNKQIKEDPALYVIKNNPTVKKEVETLIKVQTAGVTGTAATDNYVDSVLIAQKNLGIYYPKILTETMSESLVNSLTNITSGKELNNNLIQVQQKWGKNFDKVIQQVSEENKLPPVLEVMAGMTDQKARETLGRFARMKDEEVFSNLGLVTKREIEERNEDNGTFIDFKTSLRDQERGSTVINTYSKQINRLSAWYIRQGYSEDNASEKAINSVIGSQYNFVSPYNLFYTGAMSDVSSDAYDTFKTVVRVPKAYNANLISRGMGSELVNILKEGVKVFDDRNNIFKDSTLQPETNKQVRENSVWVTNSDETGANLLVRDKDGLLTPVLDKDGNHITRTWETLEASIELKTQKDEKNTVAPYQALEAITEDFKRMFYPGKDSEKTEGVQ